MRKQEITNLILSHFAEDDQPVQLNEISKKLQFKSDSKDYFLMKEVLADLCEQKILQKSSRRKYTLQTTENLSAFQGEIRIKDDRGVIHFNFNQPVSSKGKKVLFQQRALKVVIKRKNLHTSLDGDIVNVKLHAEKKGKKPSGEVVEIIKRKERNISGKIEFDGTFYFLIPDDENYYVDFLIPPQKLLGAGEGDKVVCRFIQWDDPLKSPLAEVVEILGKANKPGVGLKSVMAEYSLPQEFSSEVLGEANIVYNQFVKNKIPDLKNRLDLREETIVTIDPYDAKDFDDALSLKMLDNGNYYLGVHIADVSHYVQIGTATDKEAYKRATSVYLVDRVVPMLPEIISNEVCSLKPRTVRLAFSVFMELSNDGIVKDYKIRQSVIKSKKRYNYDEVLVLIDQFKEGKKPKSNTDKLINELYDLSVILRKKRFEKGGIDFETVEVKFELDEDKNPIRTVLKQTTAATALVEECMLIANKTVTEHIYKLSKLQKRKEVLPFLYRVHDTPDQEKMKSTFRFLRILTKEKMPDNLDSKTINDFLHSFKERPEKAIVHQMIVRSMPKAMYTNENTGHYGLGFQKYTHFTSPIRRYPDLVVHRLLKMYEEDDSMPADKARKLESSLAATGDHSTDRERVAMEAERASIKYTQTMLASKLVGKILSGTISGVTNFGIFVTMDEIYAEGLVHIRDLVDDYYIYDEQNFRLVGKVKKKIFQFGDRISVQILKANQEKRKIELKYIDEAKVNRTISKSAEVKKKVR